jgi:hypothetical protein
MKAANTVEAQLTFNETPMMETISGSKEITRRMAEIKLSMRRSMN